MDRCSQEQHVHGLAHRRCAHWLRDAARCARNRLGDPLRVACPGLVHYSDTHDTPFTMFTSGSMGSPTAPRWQVLTVGSEYYFVLLKRDTRQFRDIFANIPEHCQDRDCLLYTSDAADDLLCVDLGGRRIIKKKKKRKA